LRTPGWAVNADTPLEDIEHLIALLCKCLEKWTDEQATTMAWCVGGSLQATLDHRTANHSTHVIRFVLCNQGDWTGDKRSKIGNTCKFHCGGLQVSNVVVRGKRIAHVNLKKCTWLKCCYGKKSYGDPPGVPWCEQCEFQKKLSKVKRTTKAKAIAQARLSAGRFAVSDVTPCNNCVKEIASLKKMGADAGAVRICDACTQLMGKVDTFVHTLVVTNYAMTDESPNSGGGKRQRKNLPQHFRTQLKDVMVVTFSELDLKQQAEQQMDPILLEAMLIKYDAEDIEDLWQANEAARCALMKMVLKNISIGYHLYHAAQQRASEVMSQEQVELLRKVSMPEFLTGWNEVLVRDGCVMVAYTCNAGDAKVGADVVRSNLEYFARIGIICVAPVVADRVVGIVCTKKEPFSEHSHRIFGTSPVSLGGSPATFLEFVVHDYESAALQWLKADSSLVVHRTPDGRTPLHLACSLNREQIAAHLVRHPKVGTIGKLVKYVNTRDHSGKTALDSCLTNGILQALIVGRLSEISAIAIQALMRGFMARIGFVSSEHEKNNELLALRQSLEEDKESTTERVRYITKLAAACRDCDTEGAVTYASKLRDFSIENLDLDDSGISVLPPAVVGISMVSLEMLSLMNNSLTSLPSGIKSLPFLKQLYLDDNEFEVLPAVISEIDSLEVLSAKNNRLTALPIGLVNLGQLRQLHVEGNPLVTPRANIAKRPWPEIRASMLHRAENKERADAVKVMLIGAPNSGKSALKSSMKKVGGATGLIQDLWNRSTPSGPTVGVETDTWEPERGLVLTTFDFGGSCFDFYASPFLAPAHCMYTVFTDISIEGWESEMQKWLGVVACCAQGCKVTVVASHIDRCTAVPFDSEQYRDILAVQYPTLEITGIILANCLSTRDAHSVRSAICASARKLIEAEQPLPAKMFREVRELAHSMSLVEGPILAFHALTIAAEKTLGLPGDVTQRAVEDLERRGFLMHLRPGHSDSLDVIITDIAWMSKAVCRFTHLVGDRVENIDADQPGAFKMASVILALDQHYPTDPSGGTLLRLLLKLELSFPAPNTCNILGSSGTVGLGRSRSQSEVDLAGHIKSVLPHEFETARPYGDQIVLAPSLLRATEQTPVAPWPPTDDSCECAGYSFKFAYGMPASFFHRLQVRIFERVDRSCTMDGQLISFRAKPGPTGSGGDWTASRPDDRFPCEDGGRACIRFAPPGTAVHGCARTALSCMYSPRAFFVCGV
jgi:hypothetical protein